MTLFESISSFGNIKSINQSNNITKSSNKSNLQSSNTIQCGSGCGSSTGIVPHLVGGILVTTGVLVNGVLNTISGGDSSNCCCN